MAGSSRGTHYDTARYVQSGVSGHGPRVIDRLIKAITQACSFYGYGAVVWACAQVRAKQKVEPPFKKREEEVEV